MQKVVLITGDSSGIGRCACQRLAERNWRVYGASRSTVETDAWTHLMMDARDEASVAEAIAHIVAEAGRIDAVVHCAGESFVAPVEEASLDEVQRHFDLNVFGTIRVLRHVLPVMRRQGSGKIIVIGSIGGLIGLPFHGYYSAGKFALDGLVESLRPEIAPFGIDAAILHPGDIDTEIGQRRVPTSNTGEGSAYFDAYTRTVAYYAAAEESGSSPELVARSIENLLARRRMPVRALVGKTMEKLGVVAKRVMLSRHFEYVMALAYGPGSDKPKK